MGCDSHYRTEQGLRKELAKCMTRRERQTRRDGRVRVGALEFSLTITKYSQLDCPEDSTTSSYPSLLSRISLPCSMGDQPRSPSPEPSGPLPIRRLQESLINRIAAGEVRRKFFVYL